MFSNRSFPAAKLGVDFRGFAAFREEPRGGMSGDFTPCDQRCDSIKGILMGFYGIYGILTPCDQRCEKSL